jgi:hypothetical protein
MTKASEARWLLAGFARGAVEILFSIKVNSAKVKQGSTL